MFSTERMNIIRSYLKEHQRLEVHVISELLNVSEVTIRRDLERLEADGYLHRIHGGAVPVETDNAPIDDSLPADRLDAELRQQYDEIARIACLMVHDGDVVALLSGPINQALARCLSRHSRLTVLTNDIVVALEIGSQSENTSVLLGGAIARDERALYGSLTLGNLRNYFVNRLFVELDGVTNQLQLTVRSQEKADLIREAIGCADETIGLVEAASFGRNSFYRLGPASTVSKFITSPLASDDYKSRLFDNGIKVFTSVNAFEGDA
jgi:DeoR/GlpR family transcriptional regulator of sugar metabolism